MGKYKDNPWLGLESYQENQIIYGRNKEIEELSQCVLNNNETVLYGKSGIGKSSIINAGIIPVVRAHGHIPIVVRLDHSNKHSYIKQLADLIEKGANVSECSTAKPVEEQLLWEYFHTHRFNKTKDEKSKLVVIFDQFEEIFTLQNNATTKGQFFKELGDVLNNVMPKELIEEQPVENTESQSSATKKESVSGFADMADLFSSLAATVNNSASKYIEDNDIHFVFTLREDFLSEFEYHTSKIPSLKQHRYGLRPLNEEQAAEIILKPRPELVDEGVPRIIIETVTNRTNFSLGDEPEIDVDAAVLSLFLSQIYDKRDTENSSISVNLVKTFGKDIIKDFYEESTQGLSSAQIDFLEEELLTGENRRDSLSRSDFKAGGFSEAELKRLIDDKKLLRQFHYEGDLRIEFIHDILCPVVKERKEQREMLRQQEAERIRQEEEKRKLQTEAERKQREIEEKAAREKAEMEAEAIRVKERNRKRTIAFTCVIAFIGLIIGSYYYLFEKPYSEIYGNFTTKNGWPIGLGDQLNSTSEKEKCTVYYKLTRKGRLSSFVGDSRPFTKVEILNWKGEPTTNVFIESPVVRLIDRELYDNKAAEFAKLLSQVSYWQYTPDANGLISMKTAFDINNQELYSENYSSTNNIDLSSKHVLWSIFYDKKGNPLQVSDNGTDRVRYTISDGYITGCSFFTVLGTPQINTSGVYGFSYEVDSLSANVISQCEVDKFGDKMDSTIVHFTAFENGRYTKSDDCTVEYSKQNVIWRYKGQNDTIHISQRGFIDCISVKYGSSKRLSAKYKSKEELLEKKLFSKDSLVFSENYFFSSKLDSIRYFSISTQPNIYTERYSYPKKNVTERTFWSNGQKILINIGMEGIVCHKIIEEISVQKSDSIITMSYYDCDNTLTQEGLYSKSEIIFDRKSGNVLFEYYYDSADEICKSEMFTYNEYGIRESRAVAGIDRTPVRCPNWDWDGFSYYSMEFLKDFTDNVFVTVMGINELGDKSYIMKEDSLFTISELPLMFTTTEDVNPRIKSKTFSFSLSKNNYEPLANKKNIPFLHILNKKSTLYNAHGQRNNFWRDGLFDNDIPYKVGRWRLGNSNQLLSQELDLIEELGGDFQVLRYVNNKYVILSFSVSSGSLYAEIHSIFLTDKEYNNIKRYLK